MKRKKEAIGCFFIAIAAFLYATKHITAAIMTSQINQPDVNYFGGGYASIGLGITFWTVISLLIGIFLLGFGLWQDYKRSNSSEQVTQHISSNTKQGSMTSE